MTDLTLESLADHYAAPTPRSVAKTRPALDRHMAKFISLSPFCILASVGADGTVDVSPRGGAAGFVRIEDAQTLLMPDRPGNNRLDSFRNILSGSGEVSLLFLIPGIDDALRVAGTATVGVEPALLETMAEFGKPPRAVLKIAVREAFLHCPKAIMRAGLWDAKAQVDRTVLPSLSEMIVEQTGMGAVETPDQAMARYKAGL
jgi:uncharacterized protein